MTRDVDSDLDSLLRAVASAPSRPPPARFRGNARFVLGPRLGAGTFGVVHEAFDRQSGARIALKLLRNPTADWLYRFKREFRALSDIHHPNLVALHELISDHEHWFFTMELVEGQSFLAGVRSSVDHLRAALTPLALGIAALHDARKLHRDIKPSNVLITPDQRVVLVDFGLIDEPGPDEDRAVVGTPGYMSPEQAARAPLAAASDWYSFGVMLYEALTGRLPFVGPARELLAAKQHTDPLPPSTLRAGVPADLEALCMELLRRDPAARPSGAEVLRRLGHCERSPSAHPEVTLVGRAAERTLLAEAFAASREGKLRTVFLHAPSGMGKTALLEHFVAQLGGPERPVILAGRCYERESVPYKAVDGVVDALARYLTQLGPDAEALLPRHVDALARLFPVLARAEAVARLAPSPVVATNPHEVRRRAFAAFRELVTRIAARAPVVVWIDDFQWGDVDGASMLAELVRSPGAPAVLLLVSYRSEDADSCPCVSTLREAADGAATAVLALGPLEPAEVRAIALAVLGESGASRADVVAREAAGSPFFARQLAEYAGDDGAVTLDQVLLARKSRLPPGARRLLEVIALAGRPIAEQVAVDAAELGGEARAAYAVLRAGRLVRAVGARTDSALEIYHDRIREVVAADLDPEDARARHRGLAVALESTGVADPEALAMHFDGAGDSHRAGYHGAAAAAAATTALAFEHAVQLCRWSLDRLGADGPTRLEVQILLSDALATLGRYAESAQVLLAAADRVPAAAALDLRRRAVERFLCSGRIDEGLAAARTVLRAVGLRFPETQWGTLASLAYHRARIRLRGYAIHERPAHEISERELARADACRSVALGLGFVDLLRTADYASRMILFGLRSGEPRRMCAALCAEAELMASGSPRHPRIDTLLASASTLAERLDDPMLKTFIKQTTADVACFDGDLPRTLELCTEAEGWVREHFVEGVYGQSVNRLILITALWWTGDTRGLTGRLKESIEDATRRDDLLFSSTLRAVSAYLFLIRDEPARAERELEAGMTRWSHRGVHLQHLLEMMARVQIDIYRGDGGAASRCAESSWRSLERAFVLRNGMLRVWALDTRARAALAAVGRSGGRRDDLIRVAERCAARIEDTGTTWSCLARPIRAAVAFARAEFARATAMLDDAATAFDAAQFRLHAAAVRHQLGQLLGGDRGGSMVAAAGAWMSSQGIESPSRIAGLLVPGFAAPGDGDD